MSVSDQLRRELDRYVGRNVSRAMLFSWLARHAQAIAHEHDPDLSDFEAEVWIRMDDVDEAVADEEDLRAWLRHQLRVTAATGSSTTESTAPVVLELDRYTVTLGGAGTLVFRVRPVVV